MKSKKHVFHLCILLVLSTLSCVEISMAHTTTSTYVSTCEVPKSAITSTDQQVPLISHEPLTTINMLGNCYVVKASISDNSELSEVHLYWRRKGSSYNDYNPNVSGKQYDMEFTIAPSFVTEAGLEYYITASDGPNSSCFSGIGYSTYTPSPPQPITVDITTKITVRAFPGAETTIALTDGNPDDGETRVVIPVGAVSSPTDITLTQITNLSSVPSGDGAATRSNPVAAYRFEPSGLRFLKPVEISLLYVDINDDSIVDETSDEIKTEELQVFWYDGFHWRWAGGSHNAELNTVAARSMHFSVYALFPANITTDAYRPKRKILTTGILDEVNDRAYFDGLSGTNATIRIFDLTGREVQKITEFPYEWDGTDNNGRYVESGMYIYQFRAEVDGKPQLISGMMVIAK